MLDPGREQAGFGPGRSVLDCRLVEDHQIGGIADRDSSSIADRVNDELETVSEDQSDEEDTSENVSGEEDEALSPAVVAWSAYRDEHMPADAEALESLFIEFLTEHSVKPGDGESDTAESAPDGWRLYV